jgi:hypothetical protein
MPNPIEFRDDDQGYLAWIAGHPDGFVLNCHRKPLASYLWLHQATCSSISYELPRGQMWTNNYLKICSLTATDLVDWARFRTSGDRRRSLLPRTWPSGCP